MRYYTALIPLLGSLVASASIAPEEESTNNYVLPNAFMVHEVLGRVYMGRYGWRGEYFTSLMAHILEESPI